MPDLTQPAGWLPLVFMAVMGLAILIYVVLDGYDLGVVIVLPLILGYTFFAYRVFRGKASRLDYGWAPAWRSLATPRANRIPGF